jgi:hypothetical protein
VVCTAAADTGPPSTSHEYVLPKLSCVMLPTLSYVLVAPGTLAIWLLLPYVGWKESPLCPEMTVLVVFPNAS